jgi:dolichol-phosphate mannosyltransferase
MQLAPAYPWLVRVRRHIRPPAVVRRFSKFGIIGASGVAINMTIFWFLSSLLGLHYLLASPVAIEVALCNNYLLNNNWTFADRRSSFFSLAGLARYHVVSFGGMLINLVVLHILAGMMGINSLIANFASVAAAAGWNFSLHLFWTWRPRRVAPDRPIV